jgi:tryptophan halogenase
VSTPRFVVVGGGTAGWLTELILQESFRQAGRPAEIAVVESSKLPTIGVGEGSTAVFRQMLRQLGFDELEFLRETDATIKFGIRHKDWRRVGYTYDGPIDDPHLVVEGAGYDGRFPYLDVYSVAAGRPVAEKHLFQHLIDGERSPFARKPDGALIAAGPYHHAYHFDQALVGAWLRRQSQGIAVIDAQVTGADRDPATGDVTALRLDEGEPVTGDLFFDCTGFRRALIAREMGATWQSFSDRMPVNRAMPFWLDIEPGAELPPYTLAWAREAGWMWSIPTQGRIGCGYVYSDRFLDPEGAKAEIERALGHPIEPRNDIRFDPGRLDRVAIGNVIALGLSSAFLEPLEATSIHGTVVQLLLLAPMLLKEPGRLSDTDRDAYNATVGRQVDDFRDFINLHYVTERADTPFWRHVRDECIGAPTRERLELWKRKMPDRADFQPLPGGLAHTEEQLHYPVLDGLGLLDREVARARMTELPKLRARARETVDSLTREYRAAAKLALPHRAFLESLREHEDLTA